MKGTLRADIYKNGNPEFRIVDYFFKVQGIYECSQHMAGTFNTELLTGDKISVCIHKPFGDIKGRPASFSGRLVE